MTSLPARLWRCFHCDEVFTDKEAARLHFGDSQLSDPACQIDVEKYREMELLHERDLAEDTDKDRAIYRMQSDHGVALRREEEKGYARGLQDAGYDDQCFSVARDTLGTAIAMGEETWLTIEVCVRSDTEQAAQLKEVCDEMFRRGLPVYVSVSKRGTPYRAG